MNGSQLRDLQGTNITRLSNKENIIRIKSFTKGAISFLETTLPLTSGFDAGSRNETVKGT